MATRDSLQSRFLGWGKLVLLGGVLLTIFLVSLMVGMRFAVRGQEVETPAVVGLSLDEARKRLESLGLGLAVTGKRYDPVVPESGIAAQAPTPGVGIKAGRDVRVVLSLGPRTNPVPDLRGATLRAARLLAEQQGYTIGMVSEMETEGGESRVLAQWPPPFSNAHLDDRLAVLVAVPRKSAFVMPELTGSNLNRAMMLLEAYGFQTRVYYREQPGTPRGTVVRQFPEAGYPVRLGQTINLEVAR
jgi:beta-lactam-binding protein with PASTA domain